MYPTLWLPISPMTKTFYFFIFKISLLHLQKLCYDKTHDSANFFLKFFFCPKHWHSNFIFYALFTGSVPCAIIDEDEVPDTEEGVMAEEPGERHVDVVAEPAIEKSLF